MRKETGSFCFATRITDPPIANTVLVSSKQQRVDNNDFYVTLTHLHAEILRETVCQCGVMVGGELP